jgi:hypothetical protein
MGGNAQSRRLKCTPRHAVTLPRGAESQIPKHDSLPWGTCPIAQKVCGNGVVVQETLDMTRKSDCTSGALFCVDTANSGCTGKCSKTVDCRLPFWRYPWPRQTTTLDC